MAHKERAFTIPEMLMMAGTRVALGVGVGLLISERFKDKRSVAGKALLALGVLTTIPIVRGVLAKPAVSETALGYQTISSH